MITDEICTVIRSLKCDKSPGKDIVSPELLKADLDACPPLLRILAKVWESEEAPIPWKMSHIVHVHKKGDWKMCGNYKGINLRSIIAKP